MLHVRLVTGMSKCFPSVRVRGYGSVDGYGRSGREPTLGSSPGLGRSQTRWTRGDHLAARRTDRARNGREARHPQAGSGAADPDAPAARACCGTRALEFLIAGEACRDRSLRERLAQIFQIQMAVSALLQDLARVGSHIPVI